MNISQKMHKRIGYFAAAAAITAIPLMTAASAQAATSTDIPISGSSIGTATEYGAHQPAFDAAYAQRNIAMATCRDQGGYVTSGAQMTNVDWFDEINNRWVYTVSFSIICHTP